MCHKNVEDIIKDELDRMMYVNVKVMCGNCGRITVTAEGNKFKCCTCGEDLEAKIEDKIQ